MKMKLSGILNSLIADEYIAWHTYKFMAYTVKGLSRESLSERLEEMADDEWKHMKSLITYAQSKSLKIYTNPSDLMECANCKFIPFTDPIDSKKAADMVFVAEKNAINAYMRYYRVIQDIYPDLAQLFMDNVNDENEHKSEILDILSQIP